MIEQTELRAWHAHLVFGALQQKGELSIAVPHTIYALRVGVEKDVRPMRSGAG